MVNHIRSLLLNESLTTVGDFTLKYGHYVAVGFEPVTLTGVLLRVYQILLGSSPDLQYKNFIINSVLFLAHAVPKLEEIILSYDSRVTYEPKTMRLLPSSVWLEQPDNYITSGTPLPDFVVGRASFRWLVHRLTASDISILATTSNISSEFTSLETEYDTTALIDAQGYIQIAQLPLMHSVAVGINNNNLHSTQDLYFTCKPLTSDAFRAYIARINVEELYADLYAASSTNKAIINNIYESGRTYIDKLSCLFLLLADQINDLL